VRFNCRLWSNSEDSRDSECARLDEPKDILRPITHHMNIAGPSAGIEASSKMLLSSIKGICFSYHYHPCYFERGFVKTERRRFPPKDFLKKPLEKLRQYHDDFDIPSNKLSININYGDPGWNVLASVNWTAAGLLELATSSSLSVQFNSKSRSTITMLPLPLLTESSKSRRWLWIRSSRRYVLDFQCLVLGSTSRSWRT
jgi:hypothetical protein